MEQSKLESAIEQIVNVSSGMVIAFVVMEVFLAPILGIGITPLQNIWVTLILTVVSVLRGYCWRRFFARRLYKNVHAWLTRSRVD